MIPVLVFGKISGGHGKSRILICLIWLTPCKQVLSMTKDETIVKLDEFQFVFISQGTEKSKNPARPLPLRKKELQTENVTYNAVRVQKILQIDTLQLESLYLKNIRYYRAEKIHLCPFRSPYNTSPPQRHAIQLLQSQQNPVTFG